MLPTVSKFVLAAGTALALLPSTVGAAPIFLSTPAYDLTPQYVWGQSPVIRYDAAGNATAVWVTTNYRLFAAERRAGSTTFGPATVLYEPLALGPQGIDYAPYVGDPQLAVDDAGNATVAWETSTGGIMVATRPAGGAFGAASEIAPKFAGHRNVRVASGKDGATVLVWRADVDGGRLRASIRPTPTAAFGAAFDISTGPTYTDYQFAAAPDGGVAVGFRRSTAFGETSELTEVARRMPGQGSFERPLQVDAGPATNPPGDIPKVAIAPGGAVTAIRVSSNGESTLLTAEPGQDFGRSCAAPKVERLFSDSDGHVIGLALKGFIEPDRGQVIIRTKARNAACFGADEIIDTPVGTLPSALQAATDEVGGAHLTWLENRTARYAYRPALRNGDETFKQSSEIDQEIASYSPDGFSVDPFGNVTITVPEKGTLKALLIDHGAPTVKNVSVPSEAVNRDAAQFSVDARDDYSPVTVAWNFGDGTTATGAKVSHAYANSVRGPLTVTLTVTDGAGNKVVERRSLTRRFTAFPALTAKLSRGSFRADTQGAAVDSGALSRRKRAGALLTLNAADEGTARFSLERRVNGRTLKGKCKTTAKRGKRCKTSVSLPGTVDVPVKSGDNPLRLNGRWGGKALKAGSYRLTVKLRGERPESPATIIAFKITE